jgi:hypothetical protein
VPRRPGEAVGADGREDENNAAEAQAKKKAAQTRTTAKVRTGADCRPEAARNPPGNE